jgi:hypothetical protein
MILLGASKSFLLDSGRLDVGREQKLVVQVWGTRFRQKDR